VSTALFSYLIGGLTGGFASWVITSLTFSKWLEEARWRARNAASQRDAAEVARNGYRAERDGWREKYGRLDAAVEDLRKVWEDDE